MIKLDCLIFLLQLLLLLPLLLLVQPLLSSPLLIRKDTRVLVSAAGEAPRLCCISGAALKDGNGGVAGESPVWTRGFCGFCGFCSLGPLDIVGVHVLVLVLGFTTIIAITGSACNQPLLDDHEHALDGRNGPPLLCTQPASAQVSWPCTSDQDRAGRHGARIRHHVAAQPLPCWYALSCHLIRCASFFFFSSSSSSRLSHGFSCSSSSFFPFPPFS